MYIREEIINKAFCETVSAALNGEIDSDELWRYLGGADDLRLKILEFQRKEDKEAAALEEVCRSMAEQDKPF